jgi:hypothetical protein
MSDEDLIRRGDALAEDTFAADIWDVLKSDAGNFLKHQRILKAFRAALAALKGGDA